MIAYIHQLLIYVYMLCTGTDLPFFSLHLFPISQFIKCPVASCVKIKECSNVLVTQHKKTEFSLMDWPRI